MALVQLATGTSSTATTTVNFTAPAAGKVMVLTVGADDYRPGSGSGRPESSGWTSPTGAAQETNLGHYAWYKVSTGSETSVQYTIGSATGSVYWLGYLDDDIDTTTPLDNSSGNFEQFGDFTHDFPSVSTTAGDRVAVAFAGAAQNPLGVTGVTSWSNSYTQVGFNSNSNGGATGDAVATAYLSTLTGGSATTTTVTWAGANPDAATGILMVFKVAAGGEEPVGGTVVATVATASAAAVAPTVTGTAATTDGTVTAVAATASAEALAPAVIGQKVVSGGGPAAATATAIAPTVTATKNVTVEAVAAVATATAVAPSINGVLSPTVSAAVAAATAAAVAPTVTGTAAGDGLVLAVPARATARGYAPTLTPAPTQEATHMPEELQSALNRVAGTTGLEAQGAANAWAETEGLELLGALNAKNGTTGMGLLAVLNELAGTTGLDVNGAAGALT